MKRIIILAAVSALVMARPETYREQEDFQYSRSSSDDGTKSGYYGAQRGNMGGNYERAHNMDTLAQHQMSGLVSQVNGELGEGANTRLGSVYSSANSRGTYGSRNIDLSNLEGRNFQEGVSYDNSQLHSALTRSSSTHNSAGYATSHSQNYGGYRKIASDTQTQTSNLQKLDNLEENNQQAYGSARRSSGYQSQAGFQEHSQYESGTNSNSGYGSTQHTRLTPVRIVVRPGGRVAIPIATQAFDTTHGTSAISHNALTNDLTSDVNQAFVKNPSNTKYYESSYRYNKKWEKHDTIPTSVSVVVPTESTIPKNSELYDDIYAHASENQEKARVADYQSAHSSSVSGRYNGATSGQSRHSQQYSGESANSNGYSHTGYNAHVNHGSSSDYSNAYIQAQRNSGLRYNGLSEESSLNSQTGHNANSQAELNSQVDDLVTRPKSYQSSYSYHKSWERQGDPYIIKPASGGYYDSQSSQRLTSSTKNQGYNTYQPNSNYGNCDENCHIRVARSYGTDNQYMEPQQSQSLVEDQHLSQQVQGTWTNLEDLGQQSYKSWDQNVGQQSPNQWDNLKDLSQQSQSNWDQQNVGQQSQSHWDNLEDLGQQSQSNWDQQNVGQQSQHSSLNKLEDLSQQSQSNWDQQNVGQQTENQGSNFGQQLQSNLDQQNIEQQSQQSPWDKLEDLSQQSQSNWDQQNVGQQTENQGSNFGQQLQSNLDQQNIGQQSQQSPWDKLEDLSQQSQSNWDQQNVGQQTENQGSNFGQQLQSNLDQQNIGQQSQQSPWDKLEDLSQQSQSNLDQQNVGQLSQDHWDNLNDLSQQSHSNGDRIEKLDQQSQTNWGTLEDLGQRSQDQNTWDKLEDIRQSSRKNDVSGIPGQQAQNNQDLNHGLESNPQYVYEHQLEVIQPHQLKHSLPSNEKEPGKTIEIPWLQLDSFDSKKTEIGMDQTHHYKENKTVFQVSINENLDKNITMSNTAILPQQSYHDNFNKKYDTFPHQNNANDNSDYSYSSGFVNPFFKQNHLFNENTYAANSGDLESNIWNTQIHSNSNLQGNWQIVNHSYTTIENKPLTNIWSKFDKINTELSTYNNRSDIFLGTNQTDKNYSSLISNQTATKVEDHFWYSQVSSDKSKVYHNESTVALENHNNNASHTASSQTYKESVSNKNIVEDQQTLNNENPETPQDIGRGDIGPEESIDINESNKPYNNPFSIIPISQDKINNPTKHGDKKVQFINVNNTYMPTELSEDRLNVLSLEQQRNDNNTAVLHQNEHTTDNIILINNKTIDQIYNTTDLGYFSQNKTSIVDVLQNHTKLDQQTELFGIVVETSTPKTTRYQYYSTNHRDMDVEMQNNANFEQESVNMEQENKYNFGQEDLQMFVQQNEKLDQNDLQKIPGTPRFDNLEQQNLHEFDQDKTLDISEENRNIDLQISGKVNSLNLEKQNRDLRSYFRKENFLQKEESDNAQQVNFEEKHNATNKVINETDNYTQQTNLSRVQKSVRQQDQFEQSYAGDYEPEMTSYEQQEFDQDFNMQYQAIGRNLHNIGQQSEQEQLNKEDSRAYNSKANVLDNFSTSITTTTTGTTQKENNTLQVKSPQSVVTPKPGFWKNVGNKITSAKDKIVSWFKS